MDQQLVTGRTRTYLRSARKMKSLASFTRIISRGSNSALLELMVMLMASIRQRYKNQLIQSSLALRWRRQLLSLVKSTRRQVQKCLESRSAPSRRQKQRCLLSNCHLLKVKAKFYLRSRKIWWNQSQTSKIWANWSRTKRKRNSMQRIKRKLWTFSKA